MSNKLILQSNNDALSANNLDLQSLIDQANALPDAGGVELPELTNPAIASEVFLNKEIIDEQGNVKTGTFTIENELSNQSDLIAQLQTMADGLPEAGSGNIQTASVGVDLSGGTTLRYVGVNGLQTITGTIGTIQIVIPSICVAHTGGAYFSDLKTTGNCTVSYNFLSCGIIEVTGSGNIYAANDSGSGGI